MNTTTTPEHQIKVSGWPYGAPTPDGYYATCSCGWTGTVHGRELDANEDGKSHQMVYAWDKSKSKVYSNDQWSIWDKPKPKVSLNTTLIIWNQAVAVLREDNYKITNSTHNYAYTLSQLGLGSPADEDFNVHPDCNCYQCERFKAEQEYEQLDAYRNYRNELHGGGAWE